MPRDISARALRDVRNPQIFNLNFILGRGPGKIECLWMLARGKIGMLELSIS